MRAPQFPKFGKPGLGHWIEVGGVSIKIELDDGVGILVRECRQPPQSCLHVAMAIRPALQARNLATQARQLSGSRFAHASLGTGLAYHLMSEFCLRSPHSKPGAQTNRLSARRGPASA